MTYNSSCTVLSTRTSLQYSAAVRSAYMRHSAKDVKVLVDLANANCPADLISARQNSAAFVSTRSEFAVSDMVMSSDPSLIPELQPTFKITINSANNLDFIGPPKFAPNGRFLSLLSFNAEALPGQKLHL